jgi:hypothetical protein
VQALHQAGIRECILEPSAHIPGKLVSEHNANTLSGVFQVDQQLKLLKQNYCARASQVAGTRVVRRG